MIFTTNKPLPAWGRVLHDPDLAQAILDRVLERGRHIELWGHSYRTRHAPLDLTPAPASPSPAPARISGNHRPEFPEPTARTPRAHSAACMQAARIVTDIDVRIDLVTSLSSDSISLLRQSALRLRLAGFHPPDVTLHDHAVSLERSPGRASQHSARAHVELRTMPGACHC